jgi:exonuclease VII small subunit
LGGLESGNGGVEEAPDALEERIRTLEGETRALEKSMAALLRSSVVFEEMADALEKRRARKFDSVAGSLSAERISDDSQFGPLEGDFENVEKLLLLFMHRPSRI